MATCTLCGKQLTPPTVATPGGQHVHLACAEREAAIAWRRRSLAALAHGLMLVVVVAGLALGGAAGWPLLALSLAWLTLHARLHQRFWHYVLRDVQRWLRGRAS